MIIWILAILLLAVIGVSLGLVFLLPDDGAGSQTVTGQADSGAAAGGVFDLRVFDRQDYQSIDKRLVEDGTLPVKPPAAIGKANPFL